MEKSYLLKITLLDSKPPIWRRFVVPADIQLDELHDVIQIVMGWTDSHLHAFDIDRECYGPHLDDDWAEPIGRDESEYRLSQLVSRKGAKFCYTYDFGDNWEHQIVLENPDYDNPDWPYPIYCLDGKRACPPEDCGGCYDDGEFDDFDPIEFSIDEINTVFKIPKQRKESAKRAKKASGKKSTVTKSASNHASPTNPSSGMIDVVIEWASEDSGSNSMIETERCFGEQINKLKTLITEVSEKVGPEGSPQELQDALAEAMRDADLDTRLKITVSHNEAKGKTLKKSGKKSSKK